MITPLSLSPRILRSRALLPRAYLPPGPSLVCARLFNVLAVESSADDTAAAIVTSDRRILANVVIKQNQIHEQYGGIYPLEAARAHQQNLPLAVQRALTEARLDMSSIDGVAFTRGPGMPGGLTVGAAGARTLAAALNKPVVGVHHMQAHALTALLTEPSSSRPAFPFLTLLVSGGHTLLVLATSPFRFEILASTLDIAVGNAFDKVARALRVPGWATLGPGAALEAFCEPMPQENEDTTVPRFRHGMTRQSDAMSFTGPHTQVDRVISRAGGLAALSGETQKDLAREFQREAVGQLVRKTRWGLDQCKERGHIVKHVVVSGGVASNQYLRARLRDALGEGVILAFPPPALCTDNAVMIAYASLYRFLVGDTDEYNVAIRKDWSLEDLEEPNAWTESGLVDI
ncbi:unnamed protein product [Peniophora sp. CBMAI 1063]|nr:unnamed protein product [Peniophora sp. CBMAI 1063]